MVFILIMKAVACEVLWISTLEVCVCLQQWLIALTQRQLVTHRESGGMVICQPDGCFAIQPPFPLPSRPVQGLEEGVWDV